MRFFPQQRPTPASLAPPSYLALMISGRSTYIYDLVDLGFPHDQALSQQHEPFWHQYDHIRSIHSSGNQHLTFGYTNFNFVHDPFEMHDFVPVFIGSNTANGKILAASEQHERRKYRGNELLKPFGRVTLLVADAYIDHARLQELTRFSKTIAARFSKLQQVKEKAGYAEPVSVEKLGFTVEVTRISDGSRAVDLVNASSQIWVAPQAWAFAEVLRWMWAARNYPRHAELPQLTVEGEGEYDMHELVDLYAATLVLDIRPRVVTTALRGRIIKALAYHPSTADDFQYLHEHLPVDDAVLRKMVETFFLHGERNHYRQKNLRGEVSRIAEYVNNCAHEEFKDLVVRMNESRRLRKLEGKVKDVKSKKLPSVEKNTGLAEAYSEPMFMPKPSSAGTRDMQIAAVPEEQSSWGDPSATGSASPMDSAAGSPSKTTSASV